MSDSSPWMEGYNKGSADAAAAERARIARELPALLDEWLYQVLRSTLMDGDVARRKHLGKSAYHMVFLCDDVLAAIKRACGAPASDVPTKKETPA